VESEQRRLHQATDERERAMKLRQEAAAVEDRTEEGLEARHEQAGQRRDHARAPAEQQVALAQADEAERIGDAAARAKRERKET
jgi:hypothetical protein